MSHPATQKARNKEEKRKHILNKALELFAANGYHTTSMAQLAQVAGISKGSIYNYFTSKEELLRSLIFETFELIFDMIDLHKNGRLTIAGFLGIFDRLKQSITSNQRFLRLYFSIIMQPQVLSLLEKELSEISSPYLEGLERFFADHHFSNPDLEAKYFGSLLDGISLNYLLDPDHFPLDQAIERMMNYYSTLLLNPV